MSKNAIIGYAVLKIRFLKIELTYPDQRRKQENHRD